jgi:lipopolysaccharide/colanic/teichoic acid biosynthesis glycosyltransferase
MKHNGEIRGQAALKRFFDIAISLLAVALLAIPFALIALAIKLDSKGPVFFRQERVGKDGRSFKVWKFRTMVHDPVRVGPQPPPAPGDSRVTGVGCVLRRFGVDELPQIINVLWGEMSLVGPRPTLRYQVEHYSDFQRRRLQVKPGITSLAVVSGRNALSWKKRIELDVWYVEHWSLWLDIKILFKTLWIVLVTHEGLYGEDGVNDPFIVPPTSEEEDT